MSDSKKLAVPRDNVIEATSHELVETALRRNPTVGLAAAVLLPVLRFLRKHGTPKFGQSATATGSRCKSTSSKRVMRATRPASRGVNIRSVQSASVAIAGSIQKGGTRHG
jgi:hypothetical protein